jgi:hypothetical protein
MALPTCVWKNTHCTYADAYSYWGKTSWRLTICKY